MWKKARSIFPYPLQLSEKERNRSVLGTGQAKLLYFRSFDPRNRYFGCLYRSFSPKMSDIGILPFFKLKRFARFKDLSSQCHATHKHFYILDKSFIPYSDALCPFTVTEVITVRKAAFNPMLVSRFHMFVRIKFKELF